MAVIDRPGVIRSPGGLHAIVTDRAGGDTVMADLELAAAKLEALSVKLSDEATPVIWEKFIALASLSDATSLLRSRMGDPRQLRNSRVPAAPGQRGDRCRHCSWSRAAPGLADEIMDKLSAMPATLRSSMAEDLERGNRLELRCG